MADIVLQHNLAALETTRNLCPSTGPSSQTAGATSAVTSVTVDRQAFQSASMPRTAVFSVAWFTALAATKTLSFAFEVDSSPDGATWTAYATQAAAVVATGATTGLTGITDFAVDLNGAQRYLRLIVTPTLSATSTDTVNIVPIAAFAGFDRLAAGV